ncbi:MAG: cation-translocating P-type ATPase [Candidatus Doudnabacteria bacterium]|nr:cation-translocating P-type ATPase [Candidatus Doudnabacteria bacterium]
MKQKGLSSHDASVLLKDVGPNIFSDDQHFRVLNLVLHEIFSLLNLMLLVAAGIALYIGHYTDGVLIICIVILNSAVSFWQEFKAEQTLHELKQLSPNSVRVMRDGREIALSAEYIVTGDLILLETGDKIPADGWVVDSYNFEVNESMLTGESIPVYKKPGEQEHDKVFAGTLVATGRASISISATGKNSRFGKIAQTLSTLPETPTPLQEQIRKLAYALAALALLFSTLIFATGIYFGHDTFEMFFTAVSSMVAMVPEGLPSIILITLAVGVKRMAVKKAVVRKLLAIEGLGSVNVICTDKTGTLTRGEMRVSQIYFNGGLHSPVEFKHLNTHHAKKIIDVAVVVNTAGLVYKFDHGSATVLGDTTEGALLLFARELGIDYEIHRTKCKVLDEFSFDQKLKSMSVVCNMNGQIEALVKGSPEYIIKSSTRHFEDGKVKLLDHDGRQKLIAAYENLSLRGYRVLGVAYKDRLVNTRKYNRSEIESDLICLGFIALSDPVRAEAKSAIETAKRAGIRTVMITGDNEHTAMAISMELGLAQDGDEVVLGKEVEKSTDEELGSILSKVTVFARTNPEDKLRIVSSFQRLGYSVAVTGDGVNDSLALKQAEIGIAMGKKGTDVAKEAADIVITDDNYATIVSAIEEGRTIYDNVHKSIRYLLSTNIGEILTILFALIIGLPAPLLPVQILWINLASDGLPALALALDPKDPNALLKQPRTKNEPLFKNSHLAALVGLGVVVAALCLAVYYFVYHITKDLILARTWTFTVMIFLQMIVAFLIHGLHRSINKKLIAAVIVTLLMHLVILFSPSLYSMFGIKSIL